MPSVLVLFAHPALEKSRIHRRLIAHVPRRGDLTFHDLYEAYPDHDIDVPREQALLTAHDIVVMQHPFFWYSTPPMLKFWQDLVLEHGWAYGSAGRALEGKVLMNLLSAGGAMDGYQPDGFQQFTIRQLLAPIERTATLCRMRYLPPYVIAGAHRLEAPDIDVAAVRYGRLLTALLDGALDYEAVRHLPVLNDAVAGVTVEGTRA